MSYIPKNPYYAWVYLKLGLFEATPIPPEHLISMEISRGPGSGAFKQEYNTKKGTVHNSWNEVFTSCKLVLFDETALRVEAQIMVLERDGMVQLCYGYVNGPHSPLYNLAVKGFVTNFSRAGSATLTLDLVSYPALALKTFDYVSYEGLSLNQIVESIRVAYGWGGGITAGTVEPIQNVPEEKYERDSEDPNTYHHITDKPKTFLRLNQNPIEFLMYEIAPYCVTKKEPHVGDYRLWFDDSLPGNSDSNSISGNPLSDISNAVSDFFKGFLTNLTDPLMKEINKALGEVLSWAAESLATVQELVGSLGGFVSDAISELLGSLGGLQGVAKQAISSLSSGGLSGVTQNLTSSLAKAGMNIIKGAVGGMLDKVTGGLTNQIGSLTGLGGSLGDLLNGGGIGDSAGGLISGLINSLAGGLGGSLTKLNELTNISMLSIDSLNKFKNSSLFARSLNQKLSGNGSVMYFRPILIDTEIGEISSNYFFDVGTTGGKDGESSVLDFSYSEPGGGILDVSSLNPLAGVNGKDVLLACINSVTGNIVISGGSVDDLVEAKSRAGGEGAKVGVEKLQTGQVSLALSSETPEALEALSAAMLSIYRTRHATKAQLKIFGDPQMACFNKCQVTVMTKLGQIHYSSGFYLITKITDSITGGVYTTSMELIRDPDDKGLYEPAEVSGGAIGGVFEREAIDNSTDAEINESRSDVNKNTEERIEDISGGLYEQDEYGNYKIKE